MWAPSETAIVRRPVKSPRDFITWSDSAEDEKNAQLKRDKLGLELSSFFSNSFGSEALYIASPSLHERLQRCISSPDKSKLRELFPQLTKYWSRMCFRPTPFGLFSGLDVCKLKQAPHTIQPEEERTLLSFSARLDLSVIEKIVEQLLEDQKCRRTIRYKLNDTIQLKSDRIKYIERTRTAKGATYRSAQAERSIYLDLIIEVASSWRHHQELVHLLLGLDAELDAQSAAEFVDELIAENILLPELMLSANDIDPLQHLSQHLSRHTSQSGSLEDVPLLNRTGKYCNLPSTSIEKISESCRLIKAKLHELEVSIANSSPIQIDMVMPTTTSPLSTDDVEDVMRNITKISHIFSSKINGLSTFRSALASAYGSQEVSLLEVLDESSGIPFQSSHHDSPLIAGLKLQEAKRADVSLTKTELWLLKKVVSAHKNGLEEIELTETDLADLPVTNSTLEFPPVFCLMLSKWRDAESETFGGNQQERTVLEGFSPGIGLLGRFTHLDESLHSLCRDLAKQEQLHHSAVLAEINYLPSGRAGNIALHPELYEAEIQILSRSDRSETQRINLSDLTVCVVDGRLVLRSKKLNREVMPRLPTAHNFLSSSLPVYRFLAQLQFEGNDVFQFSWGNVSAIVDRLPQVRYRQTVISKRRWQLSKGAVAEMRSCYSSESPEHLAEVCTKLGMPKYIQISEGDKQLMLDLRNSICIQILHDELNSNGSLLIEDGGVLAGNRWIEPRDIRSCQEVIVPFVKMIPPQKKGANKSDDAVRTSEIALERQLPGGEWLYAKIYASQIAIDEIVAMHLPKFIESHCPGVPYFFVRYKDRDNHLRLRFRCDSGHQQHNIQDALQEWMRGLQVVDLVKEAQFDSYERELDRYGGRRALSLCEEYFYHDSILATCAVSEAFCNEDVRWLFALTSAYEVMADFNLSLEKRLDILTRLRSGYGQEYAENAELRRMLGRRYQENKSKINQLLSVAEEYSDSPNAGITSAVRKRRQSTQAVVNELKHLDERGELSRPLTSIVESIMHMSVNRILLTKPREHELVIYDFLRRHTLSQLTQDL